MSPSRIAAVAAALLLSLGVSGASAAPNLIVNGSFAAPNVGPGFGIFPNGGVPGWTSNNNETEIGNSVSAEQLPCFDADCQNMEVDGNTFDTISQTVTGLTPGQKYALRWAYGDRPNSGPQHLDVLFGGSLVTSDIGSGAGGWTVNSFIVTATATSEVMSFAAADTSGLGGNPSVGNDIDAVSLVAAPEPASILLMGSGVLAIGLVRRRRR